MPSINRFKLAEEAAEATLGGSLQNFMSHVMGPEKYGVSTSELWHFQMTYPRCLAGDLGSGGLHSGMFKNKYIDHMRVFSMYANEVNTPTKQITTAGYRAIGSEINYVTGSTFSEMNVQFLIPRSYINVLVFERWMSIMANDANQYVDYYNEYVAPVFFIYKFERGSKRDLIPADYNEYLRAGGKNRSWPKHNKVVGMWHMYNVFPKSIGTLQFTNNPGELVTLDVTLQYERYRFFSDPTFGGDVGNKKGRKKRQQRNKRSNNNRTAPESRRSKKNRRDRSGNKYKDNRIV